MAAETGNAYISGTKTDSANANYNGKLEIFDQDEVAESRQVIATTTDSRKWQRWRPKRLY